MKIELSEREIKVLKMCCDCTYNIGGLNTEQSDEVKAIWDKLKLCLDNESIK